MAKAMHRIPNLKVGNMVFYMNRTVFQMLDIQRRADVVTGGGITYQNIDGALIPYFRSIPIRLCDSLLETETLVA